MYTPGAVCFDLFATLISVARVPPHVGGFTADILGIDRKRWNQACFGPHHEICQPSEHLDNLRRIAHSLEPTVPESRLQQAVRARQARFDYALQHGVEVPVLQALGRIRDAGYRLALVSNASTPEVKAWPDSPLAGLFDCVVFSCEVGCCKPQQAIYQYALRQLSEVAGRCWFVGDGGSDEHRGAAAIGMKPVLLSHYLDQEDRERRLKQYRDLPIRHVSTLDALLDLLEIEG